MSAPRTDFNPTEALLRAWATNNRIDVYLIDNLPDDVWRATPPGGKGRDIASIFGHIHNVRLMWLKSVNKNAALPAKLEGDSCTKQQVIAALKESEQALDAVLHNALSTDGKTTGFKPDAASFLAYLFAHDAHHRGQICLLARLLGHPLPKSAGFGLWEWGTR